MIGTCLRCCHCQSPPAPASEGTLACRCGAMRYSLAEGIYRRVALPPAREALARDCEAVGYVKHAKFPTQIARFSQWLARVPSHLAHLPVLDLGCGPGPTTGLLLAAGYRVLAVDFSMKSLRLNQAATTAHGPNVTFVCDDLRRLTFTPGSVGLAVMADVLQHLGSRSARERVLADVSGALAPGGRLFLSFFNLNVKNYFRGDVHGDFTAGQIQYERLSHQNVIRALPDYMAVDRVCPTNIFHAAWPDRIASALPWARLFARFMNVHARRVP